MYTFVAVGLVPLPEIYSSIFEASRIAYADENGVPGTEVMSKLGGIEAAVLPRPGNSGSWPVFDPIGRCVAIPDTRFGDKIYDPMQRSGS
jgi:hypothetical protein